MTPQPTTRAHLSAAHGSGAPTAGIQTNQPSPTPKNGAQRCIRRPGSTWSQCRCEPCLRLKRRHTKLHAAGLLQVPNQQAATIRLQSWIDRGWQASAIGSALGVTTAAAWQIIFRQQQGATYLASATAQRILTATRPTRGRMASTGTRRRLQALAYLGWSLEEVHQRTGVSVMSLSRVRSGIAGSLNVTAAHAVEDTYRTLQYVQGPSKTTAAIARDNAWAPPAAWDDDTIDDPQVTAQGVDFTDARARLANDPAVIDEVRRLATAGLTDQQIAYRVGLTASGVQKLRTRHNLRRSA